MIAYMRVAALGLFVAPFLAGMIADTSYAQQSTLQQTIKPIECVYTSTQTGSGTVQDSTCEGQPIPIVTNIVINGGRPVLRGEFESGHTIMLRIWINGQWYTHGIDSRVTTNGDDWKLDLSGLSTPLTTGVYTIAIEAETSEGLLLRNTDAATFEVKDVMALPSPIIPVPINFAVPFFTRLIIPQTQEAALKADLPISLPSIADNPIKNESADVPLAVRKFEFATVWGVVAILVSVIGMACYYFRRKI